jgi:transposase
MYLSREEILKVYHAGPNAVVALVQELCLRLTQLEKVTEQLTARVNYLEELHSKNSHNSHKPPSSDGYYKPAPKSQRKRSGKKSGGQTGHPGRTLQMVDHPDDVVSHHVDLCENCGRSLLDVAPKDAEIRQVFDIPPVKVKATEHRADRKECPRCQRTTEGIFPESVRQPVQYGNRLKSVLVYLNHYQLLPLDRIRELCVDLFDHSLSEATIFNAGISCFNRLSSFEETLKAQLLDSAVVHFDETGIRINGKTRWLHVASTLLLTHYGAFGGRGQEAMDAMDILPRFSGRAIHDHLKAYFRYACEHGLCNAHHLRELTFVVEHSKQPWAEKMKNHLLDIKKAVDKRKQKAKSLQPDVIDKFERKYNRILREGFEANPKTSMPKSNGTRGRKKQTKAKNLLDRLKGFKNETLAFMKDFKVPFDNNQAERDVRMTKVKMKISGSFRSQKGAEIFCRVRAYISTVKKNSKNVIHAILDALEERHFIPPAKPIFTPK